MPEMDGAQFLAKIKILSPDTVRVMLTGNADMQTAVRAVNDGNIFRFLTKPCTKDTLAKTLTACLVQHRLVNAEKELLENTLSGSITVLTEVLSLVNPAAFNVLRLPNPWRFEVAGMMSQLGCVILDPNTIEAAYARRRDFTPEEKDAFESHPKVAHDLLAKIPRMEPIAWMIAHQNHDAPMEGDIADREMADMRLGASILRIALAFDELVRLNFSKTEAAHKLAQQHRDLDPRIFEALVELKAEEHEILRCPVEKLAIGMILRENIEDGAGTLIVAKGQEVTMSLILKLKNFYKNGAPKANIEVGVPLEMAAAAAAAK
jgi:response regulator RpfG family c-di-GMP phosphodiesterase